MEGGIVAFGIRVLGLGWVWDRINGYKTYITAAAAIMTGLSGMLLAAAAESTRFVASVHGLGDLFRFAQGLVNSPDAPAMAFTLAWGTVLGGCKMIATKHSDDKKHAELLAATIASGQSATTAVNVAPPDGAIPPIAQPNPAAANPQPGT